jgi:peptidoglycan hydrolase CwlO-like protein|tara:strand:- start:127 stop:369 length:243 start_codon:yes stop_codon:yes gene_type:complete
MNPNKTTLASIEAELRALSVDLWTFTVDDPETATVDSEDAGMTPERYERRKIMDRLSKLADQVESIANERKKNNDKNDHV